MEQHAFQTCDSIEKYFKEVSKSKLLSIDEEVKLATRIQNGDESAIDELVKANLKFVISIAKEYQGLGLPLSDLISEGNYGLIKSAYKFDPTRGFRFISYAVWWIRQSIMKSLNDNSRFIRLPSNVISKLQSLNKENESKISHPEYSNLPTCVSLNTPICSDTSSGATKILDFIASDSDNPSDNIDDDSLRIKLAITKTLDILDDRERGIVECYYGLHDEASEGMTLEAIGRKYDLTKERIRQIKEKAIRRLRHNNQQLHQILTE